MAVYTKDITSARKIKHPSVYERGIIYGLLAEKRSGSQVFYTHPYASWERGKNEWHNG